LRRLDRELFAHMLLDRHALLSAATAGALVVWQRVIDAAARQELREDDPFAAATRLAVSPRGLVCGTAALPLCQPARLPVGGGGILRRRFAGR
jgi:hypothetical protein